MQVTGIRCERCVLRLGGALRPLDGLESAHANLLGEVTLAWDDERVEREEIVAGSTAPAFTRLPPKERAGIRAGSEGVSLLVSEGWQRPKPTPAAWRPRPVTASASEEEVLELADQVYRVARRLVSSREEAEDLVQETYARAFRSWRSYTPGTNLPAWLMRILTNLNIDRGRREQRSPDIQPMEEGDYFLYNRLKETSGTPADERIVERLSQDSIVDALANVPHDFRDVIVLVDIGDFSYQEAAQILDVPIGTVMSRLHRGRRILKGELAEAAVGEES